jgi:hypothetical protein
MVSLPANGIEKIYTDFQHARKEGSAAGYGP